MWLIQSEGGCGGGGGGGVGAPISDIGIFVVTQSLPIKLRTIVSSFSLTEVEVTDPSLQSLPEGTYQQQIPL